VSSTTQFLTMQAQLGAMEPPVEEATKELAELGLLKQGDPLAEGAFRSSHVLPPGQYQGATVAKDGTVWQGLGMPTVQTQVRVEADARFVGIEFLSTPDNTAEQVRILSGAVARFTGCRFARPTHHDSVHIINDNGAEAVFVDCEFEGGAGAASPITNAGAAGDVDVIGGVNRTGAAIAGCTTYGVH
jgi:hypothetical protein